MLFTKLPEERVKLEDVLLQRVVLHGEGFLEKMQVIQIQKDLSPSAERRTPNTKYERAKISKRVFGYFY